MLTPYLPYPLLSGGQIRTYNLLKQLGKKHDITLFSLIKEDSEKQYIPELEKYCKKVSVFRRSQKPFTLRNIIKTLFSSYPFLVIRNHVPETISAIEKELSSADYDLIHAETFYMMPHLPKTDVPVLLTEQTIEYLGYESYAKKASKLLQPLLNLDIDKIRRWERHYWEQCDTLVVMSEDDKKFISHTLGSPEKIEVVANGVDAEWFNQKRRIFPDKPTVLYVGTFKWLPNVEAVDFLVSKVWPILKTKIADVKLKIVGNAPTPRVLSYQTSDESIEVLGRIPDIRDAFKSAHVLLAPVFSGKGTRYKILEAMASGTPVVATTIAVEGLGVVNGMHVVTDNTEEGMAALVAKVISNEQLWLKLSRNGHRFVTQHYDWQHISKTLDSIYIGMHKSLTE